jgi:uncharacterized surface protein with fasciclin (FAS1) repeats
METKGDPMLQRRTIGAGLLLVAPQLIARPAAAQKKGRTALDLINATRGVSIFAEVIRNHRLEEPFQTGRHGYFIPSDEAIERLEALKIERLRKDPETARQTILNHVTDFTRVITAFGNDWNESVPVRTLAGQRYTLAVASMKQPRLNNIPVSYTNYRVSNGYCHAIDGVLLL